MRTGKTPKTQSPAPVRRTKSSISMHENVPVWNDGCCSCEAEPYWQQAMQEEEQKQDKQE